MKNLSNLIIELVLALTLGAVYWHGPMPLNPEPLRSWSVLTLPAGTELNLRTAIAANWPTTGFVADPNYPDVTADPERFWREWLRFFLEGNFPHETRFCGVDLPDFSHDLGLATEAADLAGYVPPWETTPATLCNAIVQYAGDGQ